MATAITTATPTRLTSDGRSDAIERATRKLAGAPELLFDAEELVVLRDPVRTTGRPGLDLPCPGGDGEIGDERILGLARSVRDHRQISRRSRHLDRLERFAQRSDLIDLDQNRVGNAG